MGPPHDTEMEGLFCKPAFHEYHIAILQQHENPLQLPIGFG
jgi:hypothetical protein